MFPGDSNSDLGQIRDPRRIVTKTTALFEKKFGYTDPKILGAGSFGVVFSLRHPVEEDRIAIKCVYLDEVRKGEKEIWSGLEHPNIVPLLRYTEFRKINVACFEMHAYSNDLTNIVKQDEFLTSSEALQQLKTWFYQVLRGLNFLHIRQLCHLDLKHDNIFISGKMSRAIIGDFTFLSQTTSNIGR
ncbi:hypothetical protein AVEN_255851-1 [Araneus ventricosus]|uniref:Protein kinase domain-containing protein n=1 Tax=Araneus ventricosus TaxID=182803 RepID=A0A4Y2EJW8_ARAVE|nr:hypothetical protein AVEN_255851-1 [Araneus ventricosus]